MQNTPPESEKPQEATQDDAWDMPQAPKTTSQGSVFVNMPAPPKEPKEAEKDNTPDTEISEEEKTQEEPEVQATVKPVVPTKEKNPIKPRDKKMIAAIAVLVIFSLGVIIHNHVSKPKLEPLPQGSSDFKNISPRAFIFKHEGQWKMFYSPTGKQGEPGMIRTLEKNDPYYPEEKGVSAKTVPGTI